MEIWRSARIRICLAGQPLLAFVGNFVENRAEFDGLFSNINRVDEVPDEVSDEGTKG